MTGAASPRLPTARTRLVCVLGHPVAHSLSPQIHNAAFAAAGVDAVYLACDVLPERFADAIGGLRALGLLGANVTVPHKQAAWTLADARTEEAALIGAANTLFWRDAALVADNTDAAGLRAVLERDVGLHRGDAALLFGAGGAARAAAVALGRLGAGVAVVARREEAAEEIRALALRAGASAAARDDARLVINATPLGLHGEALPEPLMRLRPGQTALDLIYGARTPFLAAADRAGVRAIDGLGMLVGQAALSFARWTGQRAPEGVMRAAAAAAVGRPSG